MKSFNHLFGKIISFENLLLAAKLAQRGKKLKNATAFFNLKLEDEIYKLQNQLQTKTYLPSKYRNFKIYEPKERVISAAPYKDRVVHHAVHNVLEPIFDPVFIYDSYATRKGKGTHAAIDRFQSFSRRNKYVLKCDIKKYFQNIDQKILFELIQRKIKCRDSLWLVKKILDSGANLEASQPASQPARA